jgi:DNA modification methylase
MQPELAVVSLPVAALVIAAERTGRRAALLEIDPAYCDVNVQR